MQERILASSGTYAIALFHYLIFTVLVITLVAVQPLPNEPMGYFSFEQVVSPAYWLMLGTLVLTSIFLTERRSPLALPAIVTVVLAMRLPLFLMFKLPYNPDSYTYMGIIKHWQTIGAIDLATDLRTQFWPVSFLLLFAFRQLGIHELVLWSWGVVVLYALNALLLYLVLRTFIGRKEANYALLIVSIAPTFNFYYYLIMAPQLMASSLFLIGLLVLFAYENRATKARFCALVGLFAVLLFTHHLTALLFVLYVIAVSLERPIARTLDAKLGLKVPLNFTSNGRNLIILATIMMAAWLSYLAIVAKSFTQRFLTVLFAVISGSTTTYSLNETPDTYSIATYAFNLNTVFVYGFRLIPLALSILLLGVLWFREAGGMIHSRTLSRKELRALTSTVFFGLLILLSLALLRGLFLEVPRLFDLAMLFSAGTATYWFVSRKRAHYRNLLTGATLLAIVAVSSSLGIAVQSSQFVYYPQEQQAVIFVSTTYPNATLYTDERLITFARYFAPTLDVRAFPNQPSNMLTNQTYHHILVLISYHSISYDRYRPVFVAPLSLVLQFASTHGRIVYSDSGVSVYYIS